MSDKGRQRVALYEQAKRVLRYHHPDSGGFILACHECGQPYPEQAEMGMVDQHFELSHDGRKIELDLIWVGVGEPPKARA